MRRGKTLITAVSWIILLSALAMIGLSLAILLVSPFLYNHFEITKGFGDKPDGRNVLEIAYFIANTVVAIFTPVALVLAINQFRQAENTRKASVYFEITKKFYDAPITYSRNQIFLISLRYQNEKRPNECLSQFAHRVLMGHRSFREEEIARSLDGQSQYSKILAFLLFLEDVGVLVSKGYMDKNDCFEFIGTIIINVKAIFIDHIIFLQHESGSQTIFANALALMAEAEKYKIKAKKHAAQA